MACSRENFIVYVTIWSQRQYKCGFMIKLCVCSFCQGCTNFGRLGDKILYGGAKYFQHNYCSVFFFLRTKISVRTHRAESDRQQWGSQVTVDFSVLSVHLRNFLARISTRRPTMLIWGRGVRGFIQTLHENVATVRDTHDHLVPPSFHFIIR
jgi:hypothetical protein